MFIGGSYEKNEEFQKRNPERIKRLRLMDDCFFFRVFFKDDKEEYDALP